MSVRPVLRPAGPPVGLLDRQGRRAAVRARRGGALGRARMAYPISTYAPWQADGSSSAVYHAVRKNTLVDVWRCYELWSLLGELRDVPGAHPRGRRVARRHRSAHGGQARPALGIEDTVYLCDTWEGVVKTGDVDTYYRDGKHDDTSQRDRRAPGRDARARPTSSCCRASSPTTPATRSPTGRSGSCHIDVDVYQSAKDVLDWAWPRLSPGGVVVFDDYGFPACPGVDAVRRRAARCWTTGSCSTTSTAMASSSSADGAAGRRRLVRPAPRADAGRPLRRVAERRRRSGATPSFARRALRRLRLRLRGDLRPHASSTRSSTRCSLDIALAADLKAASQGRGDRGLAAGRRWRRVPDGIARRRALPLGARAPLGARSALLDELRRVLASRRRACCSTCRRGAGKRFLELVGLPPRAQPGRGDGRPQALLRPARPVADAGHGRLPPAATSAGTATSSASTRSRRAASPPRTEPHEPSPSVTSTRPAASSTRSTPTRSRPWPTAWPRCAAAAGACSSSGSAARPATPATPSTTSASCAAFEAYAPTDNVSELTARTNDEGWDTVFSAWLEGSRLGADDALLVFSVGGGDAERNVSPNIVRAHRAGRRRSAPASTASSGATAATRRGSADVVRGRSRRWYAERITPHTEGLCAVVWHLLVSHPACSATPTKWESVAVGRADERALPSSSAAPASSAATSSTALLADARRRRRHDLRQLLLRAAVAPRRPRRRPALRRRARATSRTLASLRAAMDGHDTVIHLASNPDIAAAMTDPAIDFDQGTRSPTASSRPCARPRRGGSLYASGSGVYGDLGDTEAEEDHGPLVPVSTYGASASWPARRSSARTRTCSTSTARAFRFGNVVGPRQTHGVGLRLRAPAARGPDRARRSWATGSQSKSYIARRRRRRRRCCSRPMPARPRRSRAFNVATGDYITVTRDRRPGARGPGPRPRRGRRSSTPAATGAGRATCPIVRLDTDRIRALGLDAHAGRRREAAAPTADARRWPATTRRGCSERRPGPRGGLPRPRRRPQRGAWSRDGKPFPPTPRSDVVIRPASARRAARLRDAGVLLVVVTNQPDVARGTPIRAEVDAHQRPPHAPSWASTPCVVCPHDDADGCGCRKPLPGLILDAADELGRRPRAQRHGRRPLAGHRGRRAARASATVFVDSDYARAGARGARSRRRGPGRTSYRWIIESITRKEAPQR